MCIQYSLMNMNVSERVVLKVFASDIVTSKPAHLILF